MKTQRSSCNCENHKKTPKYAGMMQGKRFLKLLCHFFSPVHQIYIQKVETGKERKLDH